MASPQDAWDDARLEKLLNTQGSDVIMELPGDMAALDSIGMGEGLPIWERMAVIIRKRRLNVRDLMAGFDRNKYGFFDLPTFQRALCNAFGPQWVELAMTTREFREVTEPYLTRKPQQACEVGGGQGVEDGHQRGGGTGWGGKPCGMQIYGLILARRGGSYVKAAGSECVFQGGGGA